MLSWVDTQISITCGDISSPCIDYGQVLYAAFDVVAVREVVRSIASRARTLNKLVRFLWIHKQR